MIWVMKNLRTYLEEVINFLAHKFFDKKSSGGSIKNKISSNQELAEGLRQFFKNLEK